MKHSCPSILAALLMFVAHPAVASELRVVIQDIRSNNGSILIGMYDTADGFNQAIARASKDAILNDPQRIAGAALRANLAMKSSVVFTNLPRGRYAIIVFQDLNGNGRLDKKFWGVPTEPYGFSNNARGHLTAPSFDAAAFILPDGEMTITIDLINPEEPRSGSSRP